MTRRILTRIAVCQLNELYQILETGFIKEFSVGKALIHESGMVNKFGVILKGEAGVYRMDEQGNSTEISTLKKGDFLNVANAWLASNNLSLSDAKED